MTTRILTPTQVDSARKRLTRIEEAAERLRQALNEALLSGRQRLEVQVFKTTPGQAQHDTVKEWNAAVERVEPELKQHYSHVTVSWAGEHLIFVWRTP